MNEKRYKITPDAPGKCYVGEQVWGWRIFDHATGEFVVNDYNVMPDGDHGGPSVPVVKSFDRRVNAEAAAEELNATAEKAAAGGDGHPTAATQRQQHFDKRQQVVLDEQVARRVRAKVVVLDALVGKVVCSGCGKAYHGAAHLQKHGIRVTRYDGFETAELTVGLNCIRCGHDGLYTFDGNPLIDAGIVPSPKDIPF